MIFSVIVPFLNEAPYIKKCIRALLDQDFKRNEYELIFVDNGSTDKSPEIVKRFPKIILLYEKKRCAYAACNKGLKTAKGKIIALTNADCAVSRDWLMQIYEGMRRARADIALGQCFFPQSSSYLLKLFEDYENTKVEYVLDNCSKKHFFAYTRNMAVRHEVFKKFGPFVESPVLGDTAFLQKCVSGDSEVRVVYLGDMKLTHMEIANLKSWLDRIRFYGEHSRSEDMPDYRPLTYRTKFQIYRYCVRKKHYHPWKRVFFLLLLVFGEAAYRNGLLKGHAIARTA